MAESITICSTSGPLPVSSNRRTMLTLGAGKTVRVPSGRTKCRPRSAAAMPAEVYALPSSSCACIWRRPTLALIVVNVAVPDWPLIPGATVTR